MTGKEHVVLEIEPAENPGEVHIDGARRRAHVREDHEQGAQDQKQAELNGHHVQHPDAAKQAGRANMPTIRAMYP